MGAQPDGTIPTPTHPEDPPAIAIDTDSAIEVPKASYEQTPKKTRASVFQSPSQPKRERNRHQTKDKRGIHWATSCLISIMLLSTIVLLVVSVSMYVKVYGVDEKDMYLYELMGEEAWPVVDYIAPKGSGEEEEIPSFLVNPKPNVHHVVEYYAHWCPHCKHFKPQFIQFAGRMVDIAKKEDFQVEIHAISCVPNSKICGEDPDVKGYPTVKLYPNGNYTAGSKVSYWRIHPFTAFKAFGIDVSRSDVTNIIKTSDAAATPKGIKSQHIVRTDNRTQEQIYADAFYSFDFTMRQNIFMTKDGLEDEQKDIFKKFINLLDSTLPPSWDIHHSLDAIIDKLENVTESEEELLALMNEHGSKSTSWSPGCPQGYTCGLWELYHIMTIGLVEWNKLTTTEQSAISADTAANRLRGWIMEFFPCDVCRQNFVSEFDACAMDRCNRLGKSRTDETEWKQFSLWLWEMHNGVNVRLMNEQAERDGQEPKDESTVQWPARGDCPHCWNPDGTWDEDIIYKYLRVTYWPEDSINDEYRKELGVLMENSQKLYHDDSVDFEGRSTNVALGVAIFGLLALVFIVYAQKLQKAKTGRHKRDS